MPLKHGMSKTPTYYSWMKMKTRCFNPKYEKYKDYGGRGIGVCAQWLGPRGFLRFLNDLGLRPIGETLHRKDNDGDYTPNNCKWATPLEQAMNRRPQKPRGESTSRIKLKRKHIETIRQLKFLGILTVEQVARAFKVSSQHIYRIWSNRSWKSL